MARKIGNVTVLTRKGTLKIGTLVSVLIGVPIYTVAQGLTAGIGFVGGGFSTLIKNASSWVTRFVSVGLSSPAAGFRMAETSFSGAIVSYGVGAFIVSVVIAIVTTWILAEGVNRVR